MTLAGRPPTGDKAKAFYGRVAEMTGLPVDVVTKSRGWVRNAYLDHLRTNGHWGGGEALQGTETALTLSWKNGKVATTDGPYGETKEQLGGILVLEARDMNHAVQLIGKHPALTFGNIFEIRPVGDMSEIMKASEQRRSRNAAR